MPKAIINNNHLTFSENTRVITSEMVKSCLKPVTHVTIHEGITTIGHGAFENCTGIIHLTLPNSLTTIGHDAFVNCTGIIHLTLPNSLTTIDIRAFSGCTGITHLTLPNSLTTIGYGAFGNCTGLTSVTFVEGLTTIENFAFSGCTGIIHLTLPDSLTTIRYRAFENCIRLTSVTFVEGLTTIENEAFRHCTGLTHLTLPDSLTTIDNRAFENCNELQYILIPKSLENKDLRYWQDKGINPTRTRIITKTELQVFADAKKIDSQTNIDEIATLFLADHGHLQLPHARGHLSSIHPRITKLSLSNLFSLPIPKHLILPGLANFQNHTNVEAIVSEALAPLGQWAVQAANPLANWLSWQDIARIWLAKAQAPRPPLCPPALQADQVCLHKDTPSRCHHQPVHRPNHADPRTSCTKN